MRKCLQRSSRRSNLTSTWFCSRAKMEYSTRPVRRGRTSESAGLLHLPVCKGHSLRGFALTIAVQTAVVHNTTVKGGEYLLLLIMARYGSEDGSNIFPAVSTLAKESHQHERAVQKQLRSLEKKGVIKCTGVSRHGTKTYSIVIHKGWLKAAPTVAKSAPRGGYSRQTPGPRPPDSLSDSSLIHKEPERQIKVKTDYGNALKAFLPKFKGAHQEENK